MSKTSLLLRILAGLIIATLANAAHAHSNVSGQLYFGNGPITLGVPLPHSSYNHQSYGHAHGPSCGQHYQPQGYYSPVPRPRHDRDHHQRNRHDYRHAPQYTAQRPQHRNWHQHSRDCYLHYQRGDAHWH